MIRAISFSSGDLYRVPKEAIIPGGSPIIHKESTGSSRLLRVSNNHS
jgi:hypothetical protein